MSENTTVGPAGGSKPAHSAKKPDNHGTPARDGRSGHASGSGAPGSDVNPGKTGSPVNNGGS